MRALAEFVMRGRVQAAMAASVCWFLPLLSPAIVTLVVLRRGLLDGSNIAIWAFLPILVFTVLDPNLLPMAFLLLARLIVPMGGALVLRALGSWPLSCVALIVLSATAALIGGTTFTTAVDQFVESLNLDYQQALQASGVEGEIAAPFSSTIVVGIFALGIVFDALLAVLIGRWWQAALYNPGGFRIEFSQLHMSKTQSLVLMGVAALLISQPGYTTWGILVAMPLFLVSVAVVHSLVFTRKMGTQWLVGFYLLMFWESALLVAILVGFFDAWINYRERFAGSRPIKKDE